MLKKLIQIFVFFVFTIYSISFSSHAQNNQNNNLQTDLGSGGSTGIAEPSTFEPAPVDGNNPGTLDPSSDPGGPGGDIDDLGAVPLDGGTSILLILGLLGGLVIINARKNHSSETKISSHS